MPIKFKKKLVDKVSYETASVFDVNNDGTLELITGKRYRTHCGHDSGANDAIGLYYFKINKGDFRKNIIDYGSPEKASGAGIYFAVADLNGNGWLDIVAPGKEGLYLLQNLRRK